ncbi:MAG: iron ABC transporter permease [bacterium]|nr:iron ABC transporter permease [bacterium]MYB11495.1 iron ABC transporter permease [Acidimicrobiia bacterium]MYG59655.1 iron ABC transporter permease [Acidimicrobiia bacterium]MYJ31070.1 iron ABC transporter permease [Acidimicrobiia bacterium]
MSTQVEAPAGELTQIAPNPGWSWSRRSTLMGLSLVAVVSVVVVIGLGPVGVSPSTVLRIIGHHTVGVPRVENWARTDDAIIWEVRLPRVLLGAIVGSTLGVVGVTLQALVRNPLAEPYILGVSSGASTGAAAAILFGVGSGLGTESVSLMAFFGALGALALVMALARSTGRITPSRMLVSGVAVSYLLSAVTSLLILFADSTEGARAVMFWLLGSLASADWSTLPIGYVGMGAGMVIVFWWRRRLDLLALGDETAMASGVDPGRTRLFLVVVVALCVGFAVSLSGGIGFVGLAAPHIARRIVGPIHRHLIPASAALGALVLVWADVAARMALQPRELPIGVVTGVLGAPVLVALVRKLPHNT